MFLNNINTVKKTHPALNAALLFLGEQMGCIDSVWKEKDDFSSFFVLCHFFFFFLFFFFLFSPRFLNCVSVQDALSGFFSNGSRVHKGCFLCLLFFSLPPALRCLTQRSSNILLALATTRVPSSNFCFLLFVCFLWCSSTTARSGGGAVTRRCRAQVWRCLCRQAWRVSRARPRVRHSSRRHVCWRL